MIFIRFFYRLNNCRTSARKEENKFEKIKNWCKIQFFEEKDKKYFED